jgi:ATP-binding protein involved in chromosome partitioning
MDESDVRRLLGGVEDPGLGGDIVSLGLVNEVSIDGDTVTVDLALGAPYSPVETEMAARVREALADTGLTVELSASIDRGTDPEETVLPDVENVIAVASGKGGVGKSTVSVNLAAGLSELGARVGLFDADIYGPNVPRMLAADEGPRVTEDETMLPPEKFGTKLMSIDFLTGEEAPVIWRGPMVDKYITQLWEVVDWGPLDYMIIDLPPGTGDAQLSILQSVPVTGAVVVTTPQPVAVDDARKGLRMFGKFETPVLGIVENMSGFVCPDCGNRHDVFGAGGGEDFAEEADMPFLGSLPLDPAVRAGGDEGSPVVLAETATGEEFRAFVRETADMQGLVHRNRVGGAARADGGR